MAIDDLLDFKGGNVFSPAPHKVIFPVHKEEVAVCIFIGQIATTNPTTTGFLCRCFGIFIVLSECGATRWPVDQFAHGTRRQVTVLRVDYLHLEPGTRLAHGANFALRLGIRVEQEAALSLRIELHNLDAKALFELLPDGARGRGTQGNTQGVMMIVVTWRLLMQDRDHGSQKQREGGAVLAPSAQKRLALNRSAMATLVSATSAIQTMFWPPM